MKLRRDALDLSAPMGSGAQGTIYRVQQWEQHGFGFPLIYKEFLAKTPVAGAALESLAQARADLDHRDRTIIDDRTVWPVAVVEQDIRVSGYVMQCIPDRYMQKLTMMSGSDTIPREVQHLFVAEDLARKNIGEIPSRVERLALAREAAFILGFLHKRELIFGDFSYRNAVYTLRPRPMLMLLDCDAVRVRGQQAAIAQLNSPGWGAPEKGPQTIDTDRYKLALFILRCLTPGVNAQNRDPAKASGVLDRDGMALLQRAIAGPPASRTSGKEWVQYLDAKIASAGGVPARTGAATKPAPPPRVAPLAVASIAPGFIAASRAGGAPVAPTSAPAKVYTAAGLGSGQSVRPQPGLSPLTYTSSWTPTPPPSLFGSRGARSLSGNGMQIAVVLFGVVVIGLLASIFGTSALRSMSTGATSSTTRPFVGAPSPVTTSAPSPASVPREPAAVAAAASAAVDRAAAQAGDGWQPASLVENLSDAVVQGSVSTSTTGPSNAPIPAVYWVVNFVDAPLIDENGQTVQNMRTFTVIGDAAIETPGRQLRMSGPAPQLIANWQAGLQSGLELVSTPLRAKQPVLVTFGWNEVPVGGDDRGAAWRFAYFSTSAPVREVDRLYVAPDGSETVPKPAWSTG